MEDILVFKINIKSYRGTYTVNSIDTLSSFDFTNSKYFILIDETVSKYLSVDFGKNFIYKINSCEENKTPDNCLKIIEKLLDEKINKGSIIIAIGGGVVQDLSAFVSSILFRGIDWTFFPTTLLAQCDSCIGSKSSINFDNYKNLLGTFYPPKKIYL